MMRLSLSILLAAFLLLPPAAFSGEAETSVDKATVTEAYRTALEAQAAGKDDLAIRAFQRVLELDPDHRAARRALGFEQIRGRWLRGDDLMRAKGFVHFDGRWLTAQEFAEATRPQREKAEQKAGENRVMRLLGMISSEKPERVKEARRLMALEDEKYKLAPLAKALRCEPTSLRLYAAEELGRLGNPLAVPALLKRAVHDPKPEVREAVVAAMKEIDEPSTVHPLGRALDSRYAEVRARAADAIGMLGDVVGIPHVLVKWEKRSGDFPRAYFSTVRQLSYIQDFDVEVAQTSFIADPIVGTLQEGAVQAIKIEATEQTFYRLERPAFVGALQKLSGQDFGGDLRAWRHWWRENEARMIEQRQIRHERKADRSAQ